MNPTQLFAEVKKFQTVEQLKEWARLIGFDFEANDNSVNNGQDNDHNYQNFFHLMILISELERVKDDVVYIINHDGIEVLVDDLNHTMYGDHPAFIRHKLERQ
tara:strand:- start:302 stop:610 length:309 start_codon:yes stop_codon:yes gene_type:complete